MTLNSQKNISTVVNHNIINIFVSKNHNLDMYFMANNMNNLAICGHIPSPAANHFRFIRHSTNVRRQKHSDIFQQLKECRSSRDPRPETVPRIYEFHACLSAKHAAGLGSEFFRWENGRTVAAQLRAHSSHNPIP